MSALRAKLNLVFPLFLMTIPWFACKHSASSMLAESDPARSVSNPEGKKTFFDLNDVSILMKAFTSDADKSLYLHLDAKTGDGPLVTEAMIAQSFKMLPNPVPVDFKDWGLAALRFDDCARLLAQLPCQAEIRLVFQPFGPESFMDQAIHLAFDIREQDKLGMFRDLLALKISSLPDSADGPLGEHPILRKQGMGGEYATNLHKIALKYIHPSLLQRIAIMTSNGALNSEWHFAVTQTIKNQTIQQSPIPCLTGEVVNSFVMATQGPFSPAVPNVVPSATTCADFNVNPLVTRIFKGEDKAKALENAARTNNPQIAFFASTTCVSCHLASRRQEQNDRGSSTAETFAFSFKAPTDVSNGLASEAQDDYKSPYGIRAFGWGEHGTAPGITTYTLNDTMRVAHELNDLIRSNAL